MGECLTEPFSPANVGPELAGSAVPSEVRNTRSEKCGRQMAAARLNDIAAIRS
jgi:hypothetical protein